MNHQPYRTGETWLTDDQLVLLDVLFDGGACLSLLRDEDFSERWNLGYGHALDDVALECNIRWLCERGILALDGNAEHVSIRMTPEGGALWSRERCSVWDRYCTSRYETVSRGRTLMTVRAVSREVRDQFLTLWPASPARRKTTVIFDDPLIAWQPFSPVYAGLATYDERDDEDCSPEQSVRQAEQRLRHWVKLEQARSWWRSVPELQRFVPTTGKVDAALANDGSIDSK